MTGRTQGAVRSPALSEATAALGEGNLSVGPQRSCAHLGVCDCLPADSLIVHLLHLLVLYKYIQTYYVYENIQKVIFAFKLTTLLSTIKSYAQKYYYCLCEITSTIHAYIQLLLLRPIPSSLEQVFAL